MFRITILITLLVCASAAPAEDEATAEIISYTNEHPGDGSYSYKFATSNGINTQESGSETGSQGEVEYLSPEGETIKFTYVADENGYQPSNLPPVPEYILRSLEYNLAHPVEPSERR